MSKFDHDKKYLLKTAQGFPFLKIKYCKAELKLSVTARITLLNVLLNKLKMINNFVHST